MTVKLAGTIKIKVLDKLASQTRLDVASSHFVKGFNIP